MGPRQLIYILRPKKVFICFRFQSEEKIGKVGQFNILFYLP